MSCAMPNLVTPEEYKSLIDKVELFLSGKQTELLAQLQTQMKEYADKQQLKKQQDFATAIGFAKNA